MCCKLLGVEVENERLKRQIVANTGVLTNVSVNSFIDYIIHYITLTLYYLKYCDIVFLEAIKSAPSSITGHIYRLFMIVR